MFTVTNVHWNIKSSQITEVREMQYSSSVSYVVYYDTGYSIEECSSGENVFRLFKIEFPEHCISIEKNYQ
jgi:hypothetical protein